PGPGLHPRAAAPGGVGLRLLRRHPHDRRPCTAPACQARPGARGTDRDCPQRRLPLRPGAEHQTPGTTVVAAGEHGEAVPGGPDRPTRPRLTRSRPRPFSSIASPTGAARRPFGVFGHPAYAGPPQIVLGHPLVLIATRP